jgi:hypothetical protein
VQYEKLFLEKWGPRIGVQASYDRHKYKHMFEGLWVILGDEAVVMVRNKAKAIENISIWTSY